MSSGHLHAGDTPTTLEGDWLTLSASISERIPAIVDRDDLMVACTPGAGRGSPGCFLPALAQIELDGTTLGVDPATCHPERPSDRDRCPTLWGVLTHEAAHAAHTHWQPDIPDDAPEAHLQAALVLEESRIEARQVERRPGDRHWLRASATKIILDDFTPDNDDNEEREEATPRAPMTPWSATHAAALILGRVDAGILDDDETENFARTVTGILGSDKLNDLAKIWRAAHDTEDDDTDTMLDLGRRWCELLDIDPDQPKPDDVRSGGTRPHGEGKQEGPSPLLDAITSVAEAVADADAPSASPTSTDKAAAREAERKARQDAEQAAERVFHDEPPATRKGSARVSRTRPPTTDEQAAARRLARALRQAGHRERAATTITSRRSRTPPDARCARSRRPTRSRCHPLPPNPSQGRYGATHPPRRYALASPAMSPAL